MNGELEKVQAAGAALSYVSSVAQTGGLPPAKEPPAVQAVAPAKEGRAKVDVKMPVCAKRVETRKTIAPKMLKKRATIVKPVVAKTRCFAQKPVARIQSVSATISKPSPPLKFPVFAGGACSTSLETGIGLLSRLWRWIRSRQAARPGTRRLRVASTASLGEKRFVAVVQVDGLQFLVGGGATNVVLLAKLDASESFGDLLNKEKSASDCQPTLERAEALA